MLIKPYKLNKVLTQSSEFIFELLPTNSKPTSYSEKDELSSVQSRVTSEYAVSMVCWLLHDTDSDSERTRTNREPGVDRWNSLNSYFGVVSGSFWKASVRKRKKRLYYLKPYGVIRHSTFIRRLDRVQGPCVP